jgi:hypothetical protein
MDMCGKSCLLQGFDPRTDDFSSTKLFLIDTVNVSVIGYCSPDGTSGFSYTILRYGGRLISQAAYEHMFGPVEVVECVHNSGGLEI